MTFFEPFSDISGTKVTDISGTKDISGSNLSKIGINTDSSGNSQLVDIMTKIYHESHISALFVFFVLYLVVFVVFKVYVPVGPNDNIDAHMSRMFDYLVTIGIFAGLIYSYIVASPYTKSHLIEAISQWSIDFYEDPYIFFGVILFICTFYTILYILRVPTSGDNAPWTATLIMNKSWVLLATMIIFNILKYGFKVDIFHYFNNEHIDQWKKKSTKKKDTSSNIIPQKPEVFNVSDNLYTYEDAQAICKTYDSRLATYDEIESAYQNGAEWCNYGWSEGQMAFFPTQKSTWNELQKTKTKKNDCGRPGINGGFFDNPYLQFGVNCFGTKPKPTQQELSAMELKNTTPVPITDDDQELDEKANYWQQVKDQLKLNSFNRTKWSQIV